MKLEDIKQLPDFKQNWWLEKSSDEYIFTLFNKTIGESICLRAKTARGIWKKIVKLAKEAV